MDEVTVETSVSPDGLAPNATGLEFFKWELRSLVERYSYTLGVELPVEIELTIKAPAGGPSD
jgi:hypothetical protein